MRSVFWWWGSSGSAISHCFSPDCGSGLLQLEWGVAIKSWAWAPLWPFSYLSMSKRWAGLWPKFWIFQLWFGEGFSIDFIMDWKISGIKFASTSKLWSFNSIWHNTFKYSVVSNEEKRMRQLYRSGWMKMVAVWSVDSTLWSRTSRVWTSRW